MFSLPGEVEASRNKLLRAIDTAHDLTFIRGNGNIGDHLIYAGSRRLLSEFTYREVSITNLDGITGHTALISGGGAWCLPYHDMPAFLPDIESRFEQVIILPSSFDISEESVRKALTATRALVFAREPKSFQQIRSICRAEIAHDCAFFFDYSPFVRPGQGILLAYRTDKECAAGAVPDGNNDISTTCESLDQWLWTIARYETVKTDRAHVMIAAALLRKRVLYKTSSYHKVPSIAEYALNRYPVLPESCETGGVGEPRVTQSAAICYGAVDSDQSEDDDADEMLVPPEVRSALVDKARQNLKSIPAEFLNGQSEPKVTVVILSHGRIDCTSRAVQSLIENTSIPIQLLVIDNRSSDAVRQELRRLKTRYECMQLVLLDENLGCARGRMHALGLVGTPYVAFIDNDVEVLPGAIEHLLYKLETTPQAVAVAGMIIRPDGSVQLCGADYKVDHGVFFHIFLGVDRSFDDSLIGNSGPCAWVNGTMILIRKDFLDRNQYDPLMRHYYEDVEWCLRVARSGDDLFFRNVEAMAIHYHQPKAPSRFLDERRRHALAINYVESIARFYQVHGSVIEALFVFMPELGSPHQPLNVASAMKVLELLNAYGSEWVLGQWNEGGLAPFFAPARFQAAGSHKYSELPDDSVVPRLREAIASLSGRIAQDIDSMARLEQDAAQARDSFNDQLEAKEAVIRYRDGELAQMRGSLGWRLLSHYGRIKHRFLLPLYQKRG
ncbi:MAG TPA: glycosyltransferase [Blastocatellia bacterium]